MKFIHAINSVGTNVWAIFCLLLGVSALALKERDGGLMLIGGGLALLRGPHPAAAAEAAAKPA